MEQYLRDLATESGGAGLAIGLILSIAMFLESSCSGVVPAVASIRVVCVAERTRRAVEREANRRCGCAMLTLSLLMCAAGVGLLYPTRWIHSRRRDNAMGNAGNSVVDSMNFLWRASYLVSYRERS